MKDFVQYFVTYSEFSELDKVIRNRLSILVERSYYEKFYEATIKRFKIVILIDLGGSLFFRSCDKDLPNDFDFKMKRYKYYFRPGYKELLLRLAANPRTVVAFYSSMLRKTITPVMLELLSDPELAAVKDKIGIFDRAYCSEMRDSKYYSELKEEPFDTYRDLQLVFNDSFCQENGFDGSNTLVIDSDSRKVQFCIENALITEPYLKEDVIGEDNPNHV